MLSSKCSDISFDHRDLSSTDNYFTAQVEPVPRLAKFHANNITRVMFHKPLLESFFRQVCPKIVSCRKTEADLVDRNEFSENSF